MYLLIFVSTIVMFRAESYQFGPGEDSEYINESVRLPKLQVIFPGTKWCGQGNIADNEDDLGAFKEEDKCCRSHDLCPDVIPAQQTVHNLTNPSFYTRLSCDCDDEFHKCLKNVDSIVSSKIGGLYFTIIGTQCFKKDYPIKRCVKKSYFPRIKCSRYELDENKDPVYQFFDVPNY